MQGLKLSFLFQGVQLHIQKLFEGAVYKNQYIFGLPAEIWGSSGCNIGCKTLFSERGKLPLKLTSPAGSSTFPATMLKTKVKLDFAQNITLCARQVRVFFSLPHCRFLPNSLATGPVVMLHAGAAREYMSALGSRL